MGARDDPALCHRCKHGFTMEAALPPGVTEQGERWHAILSECLRGGSDSRAIIWLDGATDEECRWHGETIRKALSRFLLYHAELFPPGMRLRTSRELREGQHVLTVRLFPDE
jgi:hypothetical protein